MDPVKKISGKKSIYGKYDATSRNGGGLSSHCSLDLKLIPTIILMLMKVFFISCPTILEFNS